MGQDGSFAIPRPRAAACTAQKARDICKATGRPEVLAEKMTDKDMVVFSATHKTDGVQRLFSDKKWETLADTDQWEKGKPIREAGKEMFFIANGERAVELGIANQTAFSRIELTRSLGLGDTVPVMQQSSVDTMILVLNSGFVTFLLLMIGMVALVIELSAPGFGIGGLTSTLCFGLFF